MDKSKWLIELSERGPFWKHDFDELSLAERVFLAIWELESEVNNGGFHQYFSNSSGDTAFAVCDSLDAIGAHKAARIVAKANLIFPNAMPPQAQDERESALESLGPKQLARLERLDEEFLAYPDDLTSLLYDYVQRNVASIRGAGDA
ncbi:MAG: DMP19 family protein [Planctomycetota bacterium]